MATLPAQALRLTLDPEAESSVATLDLPRPDTFTHPDPSHPPTMATGTDLPGGVVIAIGPEGGWSPGDHALLRGNGFGGLRLGPRVLRTETAGIAAIAALQARFGDFT